MNKRIRLLGIAALVGLFGAGAVYGVAASVPQAPPVVQSVKLTAKPAPTKPKVATNQKDKKKTLTVVKAVEDSASALKAQDATSSAKRASAQQVVPPKAQAPIQSSQTPAPKPSAPSQRPPVQVNAAKPAASSSQKPAAPAPTKAQRALAVTGLTYVGTLSGLGHSVDIVQGNQSMTSAPAADGYVMTWAGATDLSVTDGLTTEIAGHAKTTTFTWVASLTLGNTVTVTDYHGQTRTYRVREIDDVTDQAVSIKTGADRWGAITNANQGEGVVLQTCLSDTINRIVWAF